MAHFSNPQKIKCRAQLIGSMDTIIKQKLCTQFPKLRKRLKGESEVLVYLANDTATVVATGAVYLGTSNLNFINVNT